MTHVLRTMTKFSNVEAKLRMQKYVAILHATYKLCMHTQGENKREILLAVSCKIVC